MCWNIEGSSRSGISALTKSLARMSPGNGLERLANETRRVVERRLDGDLRIVQRRGVKLHLRAPRAAAEQIHRAAAADHLESPLPGLG